MTQADYLAGLIGNLFLEKAALIEAIERLNARVAELEKAQQEAPRE